MILDKRNEFADAVAIPTSAGAVALFGDVVDLGLGANLGSGELPYLNITIDTAVTGATAVEFQLVSDAQAAIATDGSATVHGSTGAIPVAKLTAGASFVFEPSKAFDAERYLGVLVKVTGTATAGKANAFFTFDSTKWAALKSVTGL